MERRRHTSEQLAVFPLWRRRGEGSSACSSSGVNSPPPDSIVRWRPYPPTESGCKMKRALIQASTAYRANSSRLFLASTKRSLRSSGRAVARTMAAPGCGFARCITKLTAEQEGWPVIVLPSQLAEVVTPLFTAGTRGDGYAVFCWRVVRVKFWAWPGQELSRPLLASFSALYCLTSPHTAGAGCFRARLGATAEDLGVPVPETVRQTGSPELSKMGSSKHDERSGWI